MSYEAQGNDSHDALSSEDDGEDDLDLLQEVIGCIAISIGEGGEYSQGDTGTKNCQQNQNLKPFCFSYLEKNHG